MNKRQRNEVTEEEATSKRLIFLEYHGKITVDDCRALQKINAPCQPVLTLRKLKTVLPSLKPAMNKWVRCDIVYKITCPQSQLCYIGATCRCLDVRFKEHKKPSLPLGKHLRKCKALEKISLDNVDILASTTRSEQFLFTLEALWQKEERPKLNTKDEYKSRELTIMW